MKVLKLLFSCSPSLSELPEQPSKRAESAAAVDGEDRASGLHHSGGTHGSQTQVVHQTVSGGGFSGWLELELYGCE